MKEVEDAELKYDILCLTSRAYYWKGVNVAGGEENNDAKLPPYSKGLAAAEAAYKLNGKFTDAYFYAAINLGKWGLAKGKLTVLGKVDDMKRLLADVKGHLTKEGEPGATFDSFGYNRTYGRLHHKLNGVPFMGMSIEQALVLLKESYDKGRENAVNVLYYAEALSDAKKKDDARAVLRELLKNDPETYNPNRVPETRLEFEEARKLLGKLGG